MKRVKVITVSATLLLMGVGMLGAQESQTGTQKQTVQKQTTCPVMGGAINTNIYVDAEGKRVYFCCNGCPAEFKKNPAKYIKKLEKDGVTLDKAPPEATPNKQTMTSAAAPSQGHDHSDHK